MLEFVARRGIASSFSILLILPSCVDEARFAIVVPSVMPSTCPVDGCESPAAARSSSAAVLTPCTGQSATFCDGSAARECADRALAIWSDTDDERHLGCVAAMLTEACASGEARACGFAGRLWLTGRGVARDADRGLVMLEQGCDGDVALACAVGAGWLGDPKNADAVESGQDARGRFEMKLACLSGQADACYQIGVAFYFGRESFPRDRSQAVRAYGRACDLGDSSACNNLGDALAYGEGASRDVERAAGLFDKSCHLGIPLGCANFGYMLEHGEGVARDVSRAGALYRDACMAGEVYGCLHAQLLIAQARGAPSASTQALSYWAMACERQRSASGCAFLGLLYEDGPDGFARDQAKSRAAMTRGCALGSRYACEWAKLHVEE